MRQVSVVGIGAGDPDDLTIKAVNALKRSHVLFFPAKGVDGDDLLRARHEIAERHLPPGHSRIVEIPDPKRQPSGDRYASGVERWYDRRIDLWEEALRRHLADGQTGAFLAWGDPALYDGTLRVLDGIIARGTIDLEIEVVPGISAIQALTARHRITLNQVGGSVLVTTGRELARRWAAGIEDVIVMLDPHCSFAALDDPATLIYWGAYLGTADEILISGTIGDCGEAIRRARDAARDRKGWIFDTYLLRRAAIA